MYYFISLIDLKLFIYKLDFTRCRWDKWRTIADNFRRLVDNFIISYWQHWYIITIEAYDMFV